MNCHPYEPCSYCSNPYHSTSYCLSRGQFYIFSYEQINTNFSNSSFYNPYWSNDSDFSWQAQATGSYHELPHPEYPQFDNQSSRPSSYNQLAPQSSLEDTLKDFMHLTGQATSDMKNATIVNI